MLECFPAEGKSCDAQLPLTGVGSAKVIKIWKTPDKLRVKNGVGLQIFAQTGHGNANAVAVFSHSAS